MIFLKNEFLNVQINNHFIIKMALTNVIRLANTERFKTEGIRIAEPKDDEISELFGAETTFSKNAPEIRSAIRREKTLMYDYTNSFVPVIYDDLSKEAIAATVVSIVKVKKNVIFEVIWQVVSPHYRGQLLGSGLFRFIHRLAVEVRASAILVESTIRSLSFWLSQAFQLPQTSQFPRHRNARTQLAVLRSQPIRKGPDFLNHCFKQDKEKRRSQLLNLLEKVIIKRIPCKKIEAFYKDTIYRNKKGRPTASCVFEGKPYRYDTTQATHVWFLLS